MESPSGFYLIFRHTKERRDARAESLRESQRRGVFVDEFNQANPHVAGPGTCRPATTGPLAGQCVFLGGPCKVGCLKRRQ